MAHPGSTARGRSPWQARRRRRWLLAAGIAGLWLVLLMGTGSLMASFVLLSLCGVIVGLVVVMLRLLGYGRDHPVVQRAASRPWRDGRDVLRVALGHLPEVFLVTPQGSLLAPNAVELRMNPADVESLAELIDISLVNASAAEAYAAEVAACSARVARDVPLEVSVVADPAVPPGRYRLRQRPSAGPVSPAWVGGAVPAGAGTEVGAFPVAAAMPVGAAMPAAGPVMAGAPHPANAATNHYHDGRTRTDPAFTAGGTTVTEAARNPLLRLVTDGAVAETRVSGARAGRGLDTELRLPMEPTVSRVHATFTCTGGEWRITVQGRNGVLLNGIPVTGEQVVRNGDSIRWGRQSSAPLSVVTIG
jgi:FHA domain-containing protein